MRILSKFRMHVALISFLCLVSLPAQAILEIEITTGTSSGIPIAIVPFLNSSSAPEDVSRIISDDLERSGRFKLIPESDFLNRPVESGDVNYKDWRLLKVDALVVGKIVSSGSGYSISFQLMDVGKGVPIDGRRLTVPKGLLRKASHQIADIIYLALTGVPGAFDTKIAFVTKIPNRYELHIADADSENSQMMISSSEPIFSPTWSPDGKSIAYVSMKKGRSRIYIKRLTAESSRLIANFKGQNSSPAFSPDGRKIAMTLSKDGNPEIYVIDLLSGNLRRITKNRSIDTEPSWSADGSKLIFTSGRSGKPQLYAVSAYGGTAKRITFEGKYNAEASYSRDGKKVVMVTNQGQGFRIGIIDLKTRVLNVLTNSKLDESPSFSPNGEMILYATKEDNTGVLSVVSDTGRVTQMLRVQRGEVREPVWSPF